MEKIILLLMITFSVKCFSQEGEWRRAQSDNTIESYQNFIDNYPNSEHTESAKVSLLKLEYDKIKNNHSIKDFVAFIEKHPNNEFSLKAEKRIQELRNSIYKIKNYAAGATTESQFVFDASSSIFNSPSSFPGEMVGIRCSMWLSDIFGIPERNAHWS